MLSTQLDVRGIAAAMGVPQNEVSFRLGSTGEPDFSAVPARPGPAPVVTSTETVSPSRKRFSKVKARVQTGSQEAGSSDELLTRAQVAEELGFGTQSIAYFINRGSLATVKQGQRDYVRRSTLEAFRASRYPSGGVLPTGAELLGVDEVRTALGLKHNQSIHRLIYGNRLKAQKIDGKLYVHRDDLSAFMQQPKSRKGRTPSWLPPGTSAQAHVAPVAPRPMASHTVQAPGQHSEHPERSVSTAGTLIFPTAVALARTQRKADAARATLQQLDEQFQRELHHRARVIDAVRTFNAARVLRLLEGGPEDDGMNRVGVSPSKRFDLGYQPAAVNLADTGGVPEDVQAWREVTPKADVVRPELDGLLIELIDALGVLDPTDDRFDVSHVLDTAHLLLALGCRDRVVDGVPLRDVLHEAWRYKHNKRDDAKVVQAVLDRWLKPPRRKRAKPIHPTSV
ncbi:hypothetical protein SAMN05216466_10693 [Paraburkholderia phenazinium]|uniref:Helix-turn-helix domain-containing protein n=1 Tax=Paraburkholderia phenazinium TaxID=60549 RepID=A0A1G7Y9R7_9BURK|nr:helix-turn-helix domain-containing protein [Paraburkholderia phenazinium]SDG93073.1 hypothetical protein SAMN05216466_10693 [Paraburkholderia phenazinium]